MKSITPNLKTAEIGRSMEFYCGIFGFEKVMCVPDENPVWVMLKNGEAVIMLQQTDSIEAEYPDLSGKIGGALTLYVLTDDAEELWRKVEKRVQAVKPLGLTNYGRKEFSVKDPDGFIITFAS